jgi:hypothetical protein
MRIFGDHTFCNSIGRPKILLSLAGAGGRFGREVPIPVDLAGDEDFVVVNGGAVA